ncbi:MAG: hypothetical protein R6X32_12305 [Chloroflexota bacterium]|jgi:hypothetical protein
MNRKGIMMPAGWASWCLGLLAGLLLTGCGLTAENSAPPTMANTGIPVGEPFVAFYQEMGGAHLFGYPITEPFQPAEADSLVQYFQTMRLEYDGQQVRVSALGQWAFETIDASVEVYAPAPNTRTRLFPETGQPVWDEFLAFYESHQGEVVLGLPLSSQLNEGGSRVQYFENGRLEWHPQLPLGQRVQLSSLGQAHFQAEMLMVYQQITSSAGPVPASELLHINISASVRSPILYAGEEQVLYVTTRRPDGRAVSDVRVTVTVTYEEEQVVYSLGQSDAEGKIQARLPLDNVPAGQQVLLDIRVYAPNGQEIGRETLGFRTWW